MHEAELRKIADDADMIVHGYAFTKRNGNISVLNLNKPTSAMYMTENGKMLESSMDEIEQAIVLKIWNRDAEYMEGVHA